MHSPHPLLHIWFKTSLYLLKYVCSKSYIKHDFGVILIKQPVASGGLSPQTPASEITSIFRPPLRKSWIHPWFSFLYVKGMKYGYVLNTSNFSPVQHNQPASESASVTC